MHAHVCVHMCAMFIVMCVSVCCVCMHTCPRVCSHVCREHILYILVVFVRVWRDWGAEGQGWPLASLRNLRG